MKTKRILKSDLAQWLVCQNEDCGRDTFFSEDTRGAMSTEESFKKFMKFQRWELISTIENFSDEGQKFVEENKLTF